MNRIEQRLSRLRAHPNLSALYESVPFHTKQIVKSLLETGATYPLMEKAGQCMDAVFQESVILQILANGDVHSLDAVTEASLDELEYQLTTVDFEDDELI